MQNYERLMSKFDGLTYIFDKNMPNKHKGLYIDGSVYLNANKEEDEFYSTIAEEVKHHLTSEYNKNGLVSDYECAEFLEVPLPSFNEAIEIYKENRILGGK